MLQFNSNFGNKKFERKVINNFLGVDYASSIFNVADYRAIDMRNLINKNGINHKRNGWSEIAQFNDKINGIWQFKDDNKNIHIIVHSGKKFYKITNLSTNSFETTYEEINFNETVNLTRIINERSYGVVAGNRLYILCGDYLVYGTWDNGTTWEIRRVEDDEDTYIPTTTIGITKEGSLIQGTRTGYDKINLLNRKRKNTLIGEDNLIELEFKKTANEGSVLGTSYIETFRGEIQNISYIRLNIRNDESIYNISNQFQLSITLKTLVYDRASNRNDFLNEGYGWHDGENGGDLDTFFNYLSLSYEYNNNQLYINLTYAYKEGKESTQLFLEGLGITKYYLDTDNIDANSVRVFNYGEEIPSSDYTVDYQEGSITFNKNYLPKIEGQANITVEFSKYIEGYADRITKCRFGTLYGYNAQRDNLFVAGNPDYPNVDFYSSETYNINPTFDKNIKNYGDFTYFPDTNYTVFGNRISEIVGYHLLGNGTQVIFKKDVGNEPTVYFRTSALIDAVDYLGKPILSEGGTPYKELVYPIQEGTIGEGCISRFGNANLNGDILMLSKNGVYGIEFGTNIAVDNKYARERSRLIYPLLKDCDLSQAVSIVYDNRYYLAVGGSEELCFVADARYKSSIFGDNPNTFNYEWWVWNNIPARIFTVLNDKLSFGTYDGKICSFIDDDYIDRTYSLIELGALTGDNHYKHNILNGYTIFTEFTVDITYDDDIGKITENSNNRFRPVSLGSKIYEVVEVNGEYVYKDIQEYGYVIKNVPDKLGSFTLVNDLGEDVIIGTRDTSTPIITGYFTFCTNVCCYWMTPVYDLGTNEYQKIVSQITTSLEAIVGGEVKLSMEVLHDINSFETQGSSFFDWSRLDFANWTFETSDFPKSYTKKVKVKGNYFKLSFRSDNDCDCAVNQISFLFSYGRKNRGVN